MKPFLYVASVVLPLVCGSSVVMAFVPGVPPASGPGSVFYGNPEAAPAAPVQRSEPKPKSKHSQKSHEPRSSALPK